MATPPTLHTADPLIAGMVKLYVDPVPATVDQIVFYATTTQGGVGAEASLNIVKPGMDGRTLITTADGTVRYWTAKVHDTAAPAGYSGPSNEVSTSASAGPPPPPAPPTKLQELEDAVGTILVPGDQVAVHIQPASKVLTVQADGTLA